MIYGVVVRLQVEPERREEFDRVVEKVKLRAAHEDDCLAFNEYDSSEPVGEPYRSSGCLRSRSLPVARTAGSGIDTTCRVFGGSDIA